MSLSMYQASVPAFLRMLINLGAILDKAEAFAAGRKIDPQVLLSWRLARPTCFRSSAKYRLPPILPRA